MNNTLVIYEGKHGSAQRTAESLGYIIGNTKVLSIQEVPDDLNVYENLVFVFSFYGYDTLQATKCYLERNKISIKNKRTAVVGVGLSEKDLKTYVKELKIYLPVQEELTYFIQGEMHINELSSEEYSRLKEFTKKVNMPFRDMGTWSLEATIKVAGELRNKLWNVQKPMPERALKNTIDEFIKKHNMLAFATGSGSYVRCSPVEYIYDRGCFYLITEGGNKFRGLLQNPQVSVGIYDAYQGMNQLGGLQITAKAALIPLHSTRYDEIMTIKGVKKEQLDKLAVSLYMIEIKPVLFEFLYSPLTKQGYDTRQVYKVQQE